MAAVTSAGVATSAPVGVRLSFVEWSAVIAGAVGAAAIFFVLMTFGTAIGLSAVSPRPFSGLSATTVLIMSAVWVSLVHVGSFLAGGYICGRLRSSWAEGNEDERRFRDGAHGFVVWAVAVLFSAWVIGATAAGAVRTATEAGSSVMAGAAAGAAGGAAGGNNALAMQPGDAAVDFLLRPAAPQQAGAAPAAGDEARRPAPDQRPEVLRIFAAGLRDGSLPARERTYLAQLVSARTGMPQAEAERRVDEAFAEAKAAEAKVREAADRARKIAALAAFIVAASLAISCAAACAGAALGGRHRDERMDWRFLGARRLW
jgi:hypothetical protein